MENSQSSSGSLRLQLDEGDYVTCPTCGGSEYINVDNNTRVEDCPNPDCYQGLIKVGDGDFLKYIQEERLYLNKEELRLIYNWIQWQYIDYTNLPLLELVKKVRLILDEK